MSTREPGTNDHLHTEPRGFVPSQKMGRDVVVKDERVVPNVCVTPMCGRRAPTGTDRCLPCRIQEAGAAKVASRIVPDARLLGPGGAPTRATTLPTDAAGRKQYPVASGVLDYFPDALCAVANLSWKGNEQHNPGQPLHWARSKSGDEADTMIRHFLQRGTFDTDGIRHSAKMAWRALAILQKEIEAEQRANPTGN